eukprot:jgi/Mesvir1/24160/Mv10877-RA.1
MDTAPPAACAKCQQLVQPRELDGRSSSWRYRGLCNQCRRAAVVEFRNTKLGYFRTQLDKIARASRKRRNVLLNENDLSSVWDSQKGRCAITGKEMRHDYDPEREKHANSASIDLIDADAGYAVGNVRLVCHFVHVMKGRTPLDTFLTGCKDITEWCEHADVRANDASAVGSVPRMSGKEERWSDMA